MATVYLIHLDQKLSNHAQHYIGYTSLESVDERVDRHKQGNGARMLRAANEAGIEYEVVETWEFNTCHQARVYERKLKNRKQASDLCPVCRGETQ